MSIYFDLSKYLLLIMSWKALISISTLLRVEKKCFSQISWIDGATFSPKHRETKQLNRIDRFDWNCIYENACKCNHCFRKQELIRRRLWNRVFSFPGLILPMIVGVDKTNEMSKMSKTFKWFYKIFQLCQVFFSSFSYEDCFLIWHNLIQ